MKKQKCHLLNIYGIYGFLSFPAFEIQKAKIISIKSEETLIAQSFLICSEIARLKWLPGGQTKFIFSMGKLLYIISIYSQCKLLTAAKAALEI